MSGTARIAHKGNPKPWNFYKGFAMDLLVVYIPVYPRPRPSYFNNCLVSHWILWTTMYSFLMQQRTIYIAWIGNYITKEYMICGCFINLPVGKALVMVKNKHGYGRISQHGGQSHWPQSSSLFEPSLFE